MHAMTMSVYATIKNRKSVTINRSRFYFISSSFFFIDLYLYKGTEKIDIPRLISIYVCMPCKRIFQKIITKQIKLFCTSLEALKINESWVLIFSARIKLIKTKLISLLL